MKQIDSDNYSNNETNNNSSSNRANNIGKAGIKSNKKGKKRRRKESLRRFQVSIVPEEAWQFQRIVMAVFKNWYIRLYIDCIANILTVFIIYSCFYFLSFHLLLELTLILLVMIINIELSMISPSWLARTLYFYFFFIWVFLLFRKNDRTLKNFT